MTDIAFRSAVDLTAAIRDREIGCRELLDHYLRRVEQHNPRINAVVTLDVERARARADAADAALRRGESWGPLHGLPMTIKDSMETAGIRTTSGAQVLAEHVPATDATTVHRLIEAGAVVFGKTNLPTWAMDVQSYNPVFGTTNNPWDVTRSPGGSSGGAAAAVAAGLTAFELGSDIAGSIRNPAHYCGVYGHKPTHGIVPGRGHIPGPPGTLADVDLGVIGPLARSAADLTLQLDVIAGAAADRAVAWDLRLPPSRHGALRDFRVATWFDDPACPTDSAVLERLHATAQALRQAGVKVDDRRRPGFALIDAFWDFMRLLTPVTTAGLPPDEFARLVDHANQPSPDDNDVALRIARFSTQRHRDWLGANEKREHYRAQWAEFFRDVDVLLCPITPCTAIPHDHSGEFRTRTIMVNGQRRPYMDQLVWAGLVGMAWLPATVAPIGRSAQGLPVGVQIVGPYLEDGTSIEFARLLSDVIGGFEAPPGY